MFSISSMHTMLLRSMRFCLISSARSASSIEFSATSAELRRIVASTSDIFTKPWLKLGTSPQLNPEAAKTPVADAWVCGASPAAWR